MKKMVNRTHIEGLVYEHDLTVKVTGENSKNPGTEFITGTLSVATDNKCLNIVPVHFTYVTATTAKGGANATYNILKNIIDENIKSVMAHGQNVAGKVRIDSAIGVNDFYSDRNGDVELVSAKRNEGGFVHQISALAEDETTRNTFEADMLITGVTHKEADDEHNIDEHAIVKGAVFDFRGALLPVEFTAKNPAAIAYFEGLGASTKEPTFTKLWGVQNSTTVVRSIVQESAFGEAKVREVPNSRKEWVITGAIPEPYIWDDEETMTAAELQKAIADREIYLATIKQRYEDYKNQSKAPAAVPANAGGFNF